MDEDLKDELLYSFTNADQEAPINFGIDTTTEEGRAQFKAEYDAIAQMTPEMISSEAMLFPHEMPRQVSQEAHFQRIWRFYREFSLRNAVADAVNGGRVSQQDADSAFRFLGTGRSLSVN